MDKVSLAQNAWLKAPPKRSVVGDFDGDGRADEAALRVKGNQFALFLSSGGKPAVRLSEPRPLGEAANVELGVLPTGNHRTACGKGAGPDDASCRKTVALRFPGVTYTTLEVAAAVYFWDGARFEEAWLTD